MENLNFKHRKLRNPLISNINLMLFKFFLDEGKNLPKKKYKKLNFLVFDRQITLLVFKHQDDNLDYFEEYSENIFFFAFQNFASIFLDIFI